MSVAGVTARCWILALFIRDDGERFLLGDGMYEFAEKQQHFQANEFANDVVEVQGNDGSLLAGQVRRSTAQAFDGYVGRKRGAISSAFSAKIITTKLSTYFQMVLPLNAREAILSTLPKYKKFVKFIHNIT